MPKIYVDKLKTGAITAYPEPFRQLVLGRVRKRLGNAAGLTQFGRQPDCVETRRGILAAPLACG
jgi:uncharacterized cupin superfamily protein